MEDRMEGWVGHVGDPECMATHGTRCSVLLKSQKLEFSVKSPEVSSITFYFEKYIKVERRI
jgi:hypothetical protein